MGCSHDALRKKGDSQSRVIYSFIMNRTPGQARGASAPLRRRGASATVLAIGLTAGALVFWRLVLPAPAPRWDEAAHALQGALVDHDLRRFDVPALLFDTYGQVYWPPLHSWLLAGVFLLFGQTLEAARAVGVASYALLGPVLFSLARAVAPRGRGFAGLVAAGLALASPSLAWYASRAMLELPGLLAVALTVLVYCRLERDPETPPVAYSLLGAAAVVTYLVKTNYGVLVLLAILLAKLIEVRFDLGRLWERRNVYAILPILAFALLWFAYTPKIASTWSALVNRPLGGEEAQGLRGLLFYPRAIARLAGSWWMATLLVAGGALAWRHRRHPGILLLIVLALLQFTLGELHHTKIDRHILPLFLSLFVLTGVAAADLRAGLGRRSRMGFAGALLGIAVLHGVALERYDWAGPAEPAGSGILDHVSALALANVPALVLTTRDSWPQPPVVDWRLVQEETMPVTAAGSVMDPRADRLLAGETARMSLPAAARNSVDRVLSRYDSPSPLRSLHVADRDSGETWSRFDDVLRESLRLDPRRSIIVVVGTADTTRYTLDGLAPLLVAAGFREVSARPFPEAATSVLLYRGSGSSDPLDASRTGPLEPISAASAASTFR